MRRSGPCNASLDGDGDPSGDGESEPEPIPDGLFALVPGIGDTLALAPDYVFVTQSRSFFDDTVVLRFGKADAVSDPFTSFPAVNDVIAAGDWLFWATANDITRAPFEAGDAAIGIATIGGVGGLFELESSDTHLFARKFRDVDNIYRMGFDGVDLTLLNAGSISNLQANGTRLYGRDDAGLVEIAVDDGAVTSFHVGEQALYLELDDGLHQTSLDGGTTTALLNADERSTAAPSRCSPRSPPTRHSRASRSTRPTRHLADHQAAKQRAGARVSSRAMTNARMPVVYIPHGGGPWPFVEFAQIDRREVDELREYLEGLPAKLGARPRAVLVISAHWEAPVATVMTAARPPMLFDYYGFPPESYTIDWPAPGDPQLAGRVRELLGAAGFETAADPARGFDHGTFVPLKLMYPEAEVPTIQLSLIRGLDPAQHLALGRALAPLRDEGVLIVGSGMSYHDMRGFFNGSGTAVSERFDAWLVEAATAEPELRDASLERWATGTDARRSHPREEHLIPLMVIAGAAGADRGRTGFAGSFAKTRISSFEYG